MKDDQQNYTERLDAVRIEMNDATCTCEELDQTLQEVRESWSKSSRASHLQDLLDKLDIVGISYVENQNLTYYINLVEKAKREINNGRTQMPWKLLERLYQCYKEYPTPVKYMQRLVDRLSGDNDPWKDDTLRLRILKRFIKYGNYLHDAGFGGRTAIRKYVKGKTGKRKLTEEDVLEHLDDGVFAVLEREKPEKSKPNGTFGLLKTADNLAEGKFRSGGAIKKSLYLFAMVYNMTYYRSGGAEQMDERTDIVKNLFQDYYANNIMRFISAAYHANPESYENPSGQGINDKNFAEMIYLYFIRCREYGPAEKIRRSSEMIARVKNAPESASTGSTAHYRALAGGDGPDNSVWSLSESDFESYVRTHYNCRTQTASETGTDARKKQWERSPLDVELAQNTAYQKYQEILEKLRELSRKKLLRAEKHSDSEELLY